eukprot:CAMPEP_0194255988 /NCGR_PEP_ID=MMETSP0158-20130606/35752_1 /TAXON_ID=33649 /ORGANISM="Thalassionema nitzschioides, Strain L26-B" /LENGTH=319 /DNA_ID=CAMNT_0038994527 /DNA_START=179 /DNA_END=1138 /DNA_ORIENTATION=+
MGFAEPGENDNNEQKNHNTSFSPDAVERRRRRRERKRKANASTEKRSRNHTLAVIIGNFRGGEQAWQSLCRNILDPSSADLAILIPEDDDIAKNSSLYKRAKYIWTYHNYDDWGQAVDLINGTEWRSLIDYNRPEGAPSIFGGVKGEPGSGAIIFMLRWFLQNHIRKEHLTGLYDRFMITRSDHYYQCQQNLSTFSVGKKRVWIPPGANNGGKTDRHLLVGSSDVLDALDVYPYYFSNEWIRQRKYPAILNTESLLWQVWRGKHLIVRILPRVMFTSAVETDTTTYQKAEDPVRGVPGLFIKYPAEYNITQENCPPITL